MEGQRYIDIHTYVHVYAEGRWRRRRSRMKRRRRTFQKRTKEASDEEIPKDEEKEKARE